MTIILTGDALANTLTAGSAERHEIFGNGGNDTMHGADGNDLLDGGTGADHMGGGDGNDVYRVDSVSDFVHEAAGEGSDTVEASISYTLAANFENLTLTGVANINGTGNTLNNFIVGNNGNNRLDGGGGEDHFHGEGGNDTYVVNSAGDLVHEFLNEGTDKVESSITYTLGDHLENLTLTGAAAINGTGNELDNTIDGNSANNVINGRAGNDHMHGFAGNDQFHVDSEDDIVHEFAGQGIDTVFSTAHDYTLGLEVENLELVTQFFAPSGVNGTGNGLANTMLGNLLGNQLNGMGGGDTIHGEGGNDTLDGGAGDDHMGGGTGNDVFVVGSVNDFVHEENGTVGGIDRVESSVSYTATDADLENVTLTGGANISGTGNASANVLVGNSGSNSLNGLGGIDTMSGGAGNDTYTVDHVSDQVIENANEGTDTVRASVTETLTSISVENLQLTGAAVINGTGNAADNHIDGNSAANVLKGLAGNDLLHARSGNDTVEGGDGADEINGEDGIDNLRAVDNVTADDGVEDRFVFSTTPNSVTNFDLIELASFVAGGEGVDDEIELENFVFSALQSAGGTNLGTLGANFYFEGAGLTGASASSQIGIYNNTTTGELFYNPTFGTANDNVVFAVVGAGAGGSVAVSADEITLV